MYLSYLKVEWMDEKTKQKVLEKAASMSAYIAYPDELLDDKKLEKVYKGLELSSDNYFESMLNLTVFDTEDEFIKLRKPVNKNNWVSRGSPMDVNAYYLPIENSIRKLFCILILTVVFYSWKKSKNTFSQVIWILGFHKNFHLSRNQNLINILPARRKLL